MNVLLMALSTFPGKSDIPSDLTNAKKSQYVYEDNDFECCGEYLYQMEPVVQILSQKLKKKNDTLDMIIMLCSEETQTEKYVRFENGNRKVSPLNFFKDQTKSWMNPNIPDPFYPIDIDENDPSLGITKAVKYLRKLNKNEMQLYLDSHGGFRGTQLVLEAILSLLKIESIQVADVFNVKFDGGKSNISTKNTEFKMFDFVSGINEFINYGRIDSLNHYFNMVGKDADTNKLLSIISGIAESIQLCNVPGFEDNLKQLSIFFKEHPQESFSNNYLSLFYQNIENDYRSLIGNKHDTLDEIEWCLKKGFYQQCLTLIEGKMPRELAEKGIISWSKDLDDYVDKKRGYSEKSVYIFNTSIGSPFFYFKEYKGKTPKDIEDKLFTLIREHNTENSYLEEIYSWKLSGKVDKLNIYDSPTNTSFHLSVHYQNKKKFYVFLVLHKSLKNMRNVSNHASDKGTRIPIAHIKAAIETYINLGRDILKHSK